jgi:hypothetical protein
MLSGIDNKSLISLFCQINCLHSLVLNFQRLFFGTEEVQKYCKQKFKIEIKWKLNSISYIKAVRTEKEIGKIEKSIPR